jgi:hypothetical protein
MNHRKNSSSKGRSAPVRVSKRSDATKVRALDVLNRMRKGASFSQAVKQAQTTIRATRKYVGSALRQSKPGGRVRVAKGDSFSAQVLIFTPLGLIPITARGTRQRSLAGQHFATVKAFLAGKSPASALDKFAGKSVGGHPLVVDVELLTALGYAGSLRGDELYVALGGTSA